MLSPWPRMRSTEIITLILSLCLIHGGIASDTCEDPTWPDDEVIARRADTALSSSSSVKIATHSAVFTSSSAISHNSLSLATTSSSPTSSVIVTSSSSSTASSSPTSSPLPDLLGKITSGNITAGEVNCRWTDYTDADVNYYTCTTLAQRNHLDVQKFFLLNPKIRPDCGNIEPNSVYCVRGFIEPVRTTAGLCGPPNGNASCAGYDGGQCCNSETWTCGNSTADCADGTCYEGSCVGDSVFTTDGTCGSNYGNKRCSGKWGECCNLQGRCGSGDAFCAWGNCNSGNCSIPATGVEPIPAFMRGNTTDGTCGAANSFSCTVIYGFCCNKHGICGSSVADCGVGCQSEWGDCNNVTSSTSSRTSTRSSSTSSKSSSVLLTSTTASTTLPAISALPSCGQTCFKNVIASYSSLGCSSPDPSCMCSNVNFGFGIRDCSNAVCGAADATTVISYQSLYCARALATGTVRATSTTKATTATSSTTALTSLPSCGQTCFNNMLAQYLALGCASPMPSCLCSNVNFGFGLRDCANVACGTTVGATVIAYGNAYCAAASASATATNIKPTTTTAPTTRSSTTASSTTTKLSMPTSTDGKCGANINGATCKGSKFGDCCSVKGNCGSTPAFCGTTNLCQAGFGTCTPVSTDGKCGSASTSNAMCLGSSFGDCCSVKGFCGRTPAFCGTTNLCNVEFSGGNKSVQDWLSKGARSLEIVSLMFSEGEMGGLTPVTATFLMMTILICDDLDT